MRRHHRKVKGPKYINEIFFLKVALVQQVIIISKRIIFDVLVIYTRTNKTALGETESQS